MTSPTRDHSTTPDELKSTEQLESLRLWWRGYRRAGCPFGKSLPGLKAWQSLSLQYGQAPGYAPQLSKRRY